MPSSTPVTARRLVRAVVATAAVAAVAVTLSACSGASDAATGSMTLEQKQKATSTADFGGMDGLVAAANAEGKLNVITLPPSWANYGKIIAGFQAKYPDIQIDSQNPNGSSADEVAAAQSQQGQDTAPDVFDIGTAVLSQNLDLVTPYTVSNWGDIPDDFKDPNGSWFYDYTGLMSIGYDSSVITTPPTSVADLLSPEFQGKVAIKGDPTQANEAASAVYWAALQSGGSVNDISAGVDFFSKLKKAGNMLSVLPTQATVASGETPVVIQWSYNNLAWGPDGGSSGNPNWKTVVLPGVALGSYYNQAVNVDAPHPAAARLWEEYLYSPEVQNLYLASGAYPSTLKAMMANGTVDQSVLQKVGEPPAQFVQLTSDQAAAAAKVLGSTWSAAIG